MFTLLTILWPSFWLRSMNYFGKMNGTFRKVSHGSPNETFSLLEIKKMYNHKSISWHFPSKLVKKILCRAIYFWKAILAWVFCWFATLLCEAFFWLLQFSHLLKNQHFPIRPGMVNEEPLRGYVTFNSLYIKSTPRNVSFSIFFIVTTTLPPPPT